MKIYDEKERTFFGVEPLLFGLLLGLLSMGILVCTFAIGNAISSGTFWSDLSAFGRGY